LEAVDWIVGLIVAIALVGLLYGLQARRRAQARKLGEEVAPQVATVPPPSSGFVTGAGVLNPAVPPPSHVPDQVTGVASDGPPLRLTICGLPALVWQRAELGPNSYQGTRVSLIIDAGVGLPVIQVFHHEGFLRAFADAHGPSGIAALDERFKIAGDIDAWRPVLSSPAVQQALLRYPLETFTVLGGRLTFVSGDGVHLDRSATSAIVWVAATIIAAIPPDITSASSTAPPTALASTGLTSADAIVSSVLAKSNLTPEQQQAMMAMIRANQRADEHE
jgi:hypothetical protein